MVIFDVSNLDSNTPYELRKQAISFWKNKNKTLHPRFNTKFIMDAVELILNNKSFQFDNINYIQIIGTTMGTKMAPQL